MSPGTIFMLPILAIVGIFGAAALRVKFGTPPAPLPPLPPGTVSGKGYGQYLYGRRIA
jgi:hypothetical protein